MSWYNAIFINWFGLKLMIPFVLMMLNIWTGLIAFGVWSVSYVYYFNKLLSKNKEGER